MTATADGDQTPTTTATTTIAASPSGSGCAGRGGRIPYRVGIGRALDALDELGDPSRRRADDASARPGGIDIQPPPQVRPATPATPPGTPAVRTVGGTLVHGPRWYRARIRWLGPLLALLPPLVVGLGGLALLRVGDSRVTGIAGLVTGLWAAPGLLVLGAPLSDSGSYPLGIALSVVAWLAIGLLAARRATRDPMADFGQFWRQYIWAAAGILVGVIAALVVVGVVYGEALL